MAGQTKVVARCDVDSDRLEIAAEEVQDICGDQPRTYGDFRELFEKESVEIAIIATPDHWHALNALAAIEAVLTSLSKNLQAILSVRAKPFSERRVMPGGQFKSDCTEGLVRIMFPE